MLQSGRVDYHSPMPATRYPVFLSYNHRDRDFARWLHRAIESFTPPRIARGEAKRLPPLSPVFMDREELASSGDLAQSVQTALEASENLVVVCSPHAAQSKWVNEEVKAFQKLGRGDKIFCIVAQGDPSQLPRTPDEIGVGCFPIALLFDEAGNRRPEPLAADARPNADGKDAARLKIIAGLLGVPYDSLRQREALRKQKRLALLATGATIGLIITSGLAVSAWLSRNEAQKQRVVAEQKTLTAQRTVDFLKSMFADADPTQARGDKLTVRELVDRASVRIEDDLKGEQEVRAELMKTLGEVYGGLGIYGKGAALVEAAQANTPIGSVSRASQDVTLADIRNSEGNYAAAAKLFNQAITALSATGLKPSKDLFAAYAGLGSTLSATGEFDAARTTLKKGMALVPDGKHFEESRIELSYFIGTNEYFANQKQVTKEILSTALAQRVALSGETHPHAIKMLNVFGAMALAEKNYPDAERFFVRTVGAHEKVLGNDHPAVAVARANLARLRVEQRNYPDALKTLTDSAQNISTQISPDHDDLAFIYANLALAQQGTGDDASAEANFLKALPIARKHNHRTLPQTLADIAEIECRSKRVSAGLARLDEAQPLMLKFYPTDAWRASYVEQIRGACLIAQGNQAEGIALLEESTPVLVERWGEAGLYGYDASRRLKAARKLAPLAKK